MWLAEPIITWFQEVNLAHTMQKAGMALDRITRKIDHDNAR